MLGNVNTGSALSAFEKMEEKGTLWLYNMCLFPLTVSIVMPASLVGTSGCPFLAPLLEPFDLVHCDLWTSPVLSVWLQVLPGHPR
jgi:hypothetical protein